MSDIMIDLETLSTRNDAVILTIGAVKFNINKELDKTKQLYMRINLQSCKNLKMHTDRSTVKWWKEQSKEAQYEVFENPDRIDIKDALVKLSEFLKNGKCIWANSPNFDCVILENAFNKCGIDIPWKFWNLRDCRTVYGLARLNLSSFRKNIEDESSAHNALNDCVMQILALKESFKILGL
jgi:exodeoxyribonuclease VIII